MTRQPWESDDRDLAAELDDFDERHGRTAELAEYVGASDRAERAEVTVDPTALPRTAGGLRVEAQEGDGAGNHFKNVDAVHDGPRDSPARTLLGFGIVDDPRRSRRMWKLHTDIPVTVYLEGQIYDTPSMDTAARCDRSRLDVLVSKLELPRILHERVFHLVRTEEMLANWNLVGGHPTAVLGYGAAVRAHSAEEARQFAESFADRFDLSTTEARHAADWAGERLRQRFGEESPSMDSAQPADERAADA